MRMREQPSQHPAVGMPDQHVGQLDPATVEQSLEITDLITRVVHAGNRVARANARPIVRAGTGLLTEFRQHVHPGIGAAAEARFEQHGRAAGALALHVETAPADIDELA